MNVLDSIYRAALKAVDPATCVRDALQAWDPGEGRILLAGAGKAAATMALGAEAVVGTDRVSAGVLITKDEHTLGYAHPRVQVFEAAHPVPDLRGSDATGRLLSFLGGTRKTDRVLFLLSGGGSALLVRPAEGLCLADLQHTNQALLACGASIGEVNTVRKHLSQVKGGRLARHLAPARCLVLVLSDVLGNPLDAIASGPCVADPTTFAEAVEVVQKYKLELGPAVMTHLAAGCAGEVEDTPKPGDPVFERIEHVIVGDNRRMARAALEKARALSLRAELCDLELEGEARDVARELAHQGRKSGPGCFIYSGETTVTLRGEGRGGRCQELALAFALECDGLPGISLLAGSSDGTDGPTDAAGAMVDGGTCTRARALGLEPRGHLERNDSYAFFKQLDELLVTGPTGTNTNDLLVLKVD